MTLLLLVITMGNELQQQKNLGKTFVQWLNAVGIHDRQDLQKIGVIGAYWKVKTRGFNTSRVFLYALQGALTNQHWRDLSAADKAALVKQANALQESN